MIAILKNIADFSASRLKVDWKEVAFFVGTLGVSLFLAYITHELGINVFAE